MESVLIVANVHDGRRYRLVIRGSLSRITGAKVKKYMTSHVGTAAAGMVLRYNGQEMTDGTTAGDVGLQNGDTVLLELRDCGVSEATSAQLHEAESLDGQRGMFELEADRRQQEYARTIQDLANEMSDKERHAQMLETDLKERQLQIRRVEEEKATAMAEKRRLEELRQQEMEKQRERDAELRRREQQLLEERERHRELELGRLELERKQQLLMQQKLEAERERERVERERREYEEQMAAQEEEVRARQARLERERLEHQRRERELERDRALLESRKRQELETFGREKQLDDFRLKEIRSAASGVHGDLQKAATVAAAVVTPQPPPGPPPPPPPQLPQPPAATPLAPPEPPQDCTTLAEANLEDLAKHLGQPLQFDESKTCVVDVDDKHTIMISYDRETEGLYIYSSLLCNLPRDPAVKVQLYEMLLEGALLGRDMAGGGVGLSLKDDFILMCTSVPLHSCLPTALRLAVPVFAEALRRWRRRIKDLLSPSVARPPASVSGGASALPRDFPSPASFVPSEASAATDECYAVIGVELTDGVTIGGVHTQYNSGVIVVRVKGPAAAAGLKENDIIKYVNGARVSNLASFQEATAALLPEVPATFLVERNGQETSLEVRPGRGFKKPGEQRRYRVAEDVLTSAGTR